MSLTTAEKKQQYGWKTETTADGKETKIILEPGGFVPGIDTKREDEKMETTEQYQREERPTSEQAETNIWIGKTRSKKDLILVLKAEDVLPLFKDENGNTKDVVLLFNPRDVRDVITDSWSGAKARELRRRVESDSTKGF